MNDVSILYRTEAVYSFEDLARSFDGRRKHDGETLITDTTPPTLPPSNGLEIVRSVLRRLHPDHKHKAAADAILKGTSIADSERDAAMTHTIATIVNHVYQEYKDGLVTPQIIANVYRDSLAVWAAEPDATKTLAEELEKVVEKSERMFDKKKEEEGARLKGIEAMRRGLRLDGKETTEENLPSDQLRQLAIIQYRTGYFAHSFGWAANPDKTGFFGPFIKEELLAQLDGLWENAPAAFELSYYNDKGEEKAKAVQTLVQEYGTGAVEVVGHLFLQDSYFDVVSRYYHRAFCPFRILEPLFDEKIDAWLRLMGGDHQEQLLDWVAAVPQLDRQNCALYLEGPPAIGKSSLFALGLSRLWRTTGPSHFANLMAGFNADMFSCPLVLLDEGLPRSASHTSAFIRSLIGSSEHTFNQKNQPMHKVLGNIRLIIAANDDSVLSQLSNEELSEQSLEAVAGRFLHIVGQREAADWIREQNNKDRGVIDAWIQDDLIAKHALWLAENRTITPGKRFLVEGEATEMHRSLVTRGEKQGLVLEWLCRFLLDPQRVERDLAVKKQDGLVRLGDGHFLINTQVVVDNWTIFRQPEQKLTPSMIGRMLARVSYGKRKLGHLKRTRFHDINFANVKSAAEELQLDIEAMEENLNRKIEIEDIQQ